MTNKTVVNVSVLIGAIIIFSTLIAYAENVHREEIRVIDYLYRNVIEYRFNDHLLATHDRLLSHNLQIREDHLMIFSMSRNNFLIISSNNEGYLNSVNVGGIIHECSVLENTELCGQSLKLARMWRSKLNIVGILLGEDRELNSSMRQFTPHRM